MKSLHTPAPWLLDPDTPGHVMTHEGYAIADCFLVYSSIDKRQCLANARLIAGAPELYELLSRGLESGVFDGAPVFERDVVELLSEITGRK